MLRGQRTEVLREWIWVLDATTGNWRTLQDYETDNDDVVVAFSPVFKAQLDDTGKKLHGFGIFVDTKTGQVEAKAAPAGAAPSNFILEVSVEENGDGIAAPLIPYGILRVHVHRSIEKVWLTPEKLSVRRSRVAGNEEITDVVFAVRAQFDDGTVADITASNQIEFTPAPWFVARWVRIPASAGNTVAPFTISVTTSANWNAKSATATLEVLPRWQDEPNVPTAELVDGVPGVWDGTLKPERVPNVLLLGSGFKEDDRDGFREITNLVVHQMKKDPLMQPFGYLGTSINYWRLMVPARERGISVRSEVQQGMQEGQLFAWTIPSPAEPPPAAVDWEVQHLCYMAGLPVPDDFNLVADADTHLPLQNLDALRAHDSGKLDFSVLEAKWFATMRLDHPVPMVQSIPRRVIKQWLAMCDRTFIDEVDNYPPASIGVPPAASRGDNNLLLFHENRLRFGGSSDERLAFFRRVRAEPRNGVTVTLDDVGPLAPELGNLWSELRDGFAFDNRAFVATFSNMPYGRANAAIHTRLSVYANPPQGDLFVMSSVPVARDPVRHALKLALPEPRVAILDDDTWRVFAHELAHKFGLGDEYAEGPSSYDGTEEGLASDGNLTAAATVLDPDTQKVRYGEIKWNWHRIRNASVLTRPLGLRIDGLFLAFVRKGSGHQFAPGDFVRLRQRDSRKVLGKDPVISNVEFVVDSIHPTNLDQPSDPFSMTVVLKNQSIGVNFELFGAGSIVYKPIPAAPPLWDPVLHPYLTLVSPGAQRIMDKIGGTMTGVACDVGVLSDNLGSGTQVPVAEDPENRIAKADLPDVVGVYYGGQLHACGILHPTGHCMMRNSHSGHGAVLPRLSVRPRRPHRSRSALVDRSRVRQEVSALSTNANTGSTPWPTSSATRSRRSRDI